MNGKPVCYDINTTASFPGLVEVCIQYDGTGLSLGKQSGLKLAQLVSGQWVDLQDITVDAADDIICGYTDHFSTFAVQVPPVVGGIAEFSSVDGITLVSEGSSGGGVLPIATAVAAVLASVAAGGWYVRRRFLR